MKCASRSTCREESGSGQRKEREGRHLLTGAHAKLRRTDLNNRIKPDKKLLLLRLAMANTSLIRNAILTPNGPIEGAE